MRETAPRWGELRATRRRLEITGTELAARAGISRSYLGALESGRRRATFAMHALLADAMGMEPRELALPAHLAEQVATATGAEAGAPAPTR